MELVGVKVESNEERKPERKEAKRANRMDSRHRTRETMIVTMLMKIMAFIGLLEALASDVRKENECARPEDKRGDCLSRCENLKIETWILNVVPNGC